MRLCVVFVVAAAVSFAQLPQGSFDRTLLGQRRGPA